MITVSFRSENARSPRNARNGTDSFNMNYYRHQLQSADLANVARQYDLSFVCTVVSMDGLSSKFTSTSRSMLYGLQTGRTQASRVSLSGTMPPEGTSGACRCYDRTGVAERVSDASRLTCISRSSPVEVQARSAASELRLRFNPPTNSSSQRVQLAGRAFCTLCSSRNLPT